MPQPQQDPYEVLGIPRSANRAQIKAAYRKLALKHHPDKVPGDEAAKRAASETFAAISHAYETLTNPNATTIENNQPSSPGFEPFPSDFFDDEMAFGLAGPGTGFFFNPSFHFTDPFELFEQTFGHPMNGGGMDPMAAMMASMRTSMRNSSSSAFFASSSTFSSSSVRSITDPITGITKHTKTITQTVNGVQSKRTETTIIHPDGRTQTTVQDHTHNSHPKPLPTSPTATTISHQQTLNHTHTPPNRPQTTSPKRTPTQDPTHKSSNSWQEAPTFANLNGTPQHNAHPSDPSIPNGNAASRQNEQGQIEHYDNPTQDEDHNEIDNDQSAHSDQHLQSKSQSLSQCQTTAYSSQPPPSPSSSSHSHSKPSHEQQPVIDLTHTDNISSDHVSDHFSDHVSDHVTDHGNTISSNTDITNNTSHNTHNNSHYLPQDQAQYPPHPDTFAQYTQHELDNHYEVDLDSHLDHHYPLPDVEESQSPTQYPQLHQDELTQYPTQQYHPAEQHNLHLQELLPHTHAQPHPHPPLYPDHHDSSYLYPSQLDSSHPKKRQRTDRHNHETWTSPLHIVNSSSMPQHSQTSSYSHHDFFTNGKTHNLPSQNAAATQVQARLEEIDGKSLTTKAQIRCLTVKELKDALRARGQKVGGVKEELVERLFQSQQRHHSPLEPS